MLLIVVLSSLVMTKMDGDPLAVGLLAARAHHRRNSGDAEQKKRQTKMHIS